MPRAIKQVKTSQSHKHLYKLIGIITGIVLVVTFIFLTFSPWPDPFNNWREDSKGVNKFHFFDYSEVEEYYYVNLADIKISLDDVRYNLNSNYDKNSLSSSSIYDITQDDVYIYVYKANSESTAWEKKDAFIEMINGFYDTIKAVNEDSNYQVGFYLVEISENSNSSIVADYGFSSTPTIIEFHGSSNYLVHEGYSSCVTLIRSLNNSEANGTYVDFTKNNE